MKKQELIEKLREHTNLEKGQSTIIVDLFFDSIAQTLTDGERVEIRGFCSFSTKQYEGYVGRNPKTGKSVVVKEKILPVFRAGRELIDRINNE